MDQIIQELEGILNLNLSMTEKSKKFTDREFLISDFKLFLDDMKLLGNPEILYSSLNFPSEFPHGHTTVDSRKNIPCNFDTTAAIRVDIETLSKNVDKILKGKYFLCRIIAPLFRMKSVITIADDPKGISAVRLALYNSGFRDEDLPIGRILVIRNPWLQQLSADRGFCVRCNKASEVLVIPHHEFEEKFPGLIWEGEIPRKYKTSISNLPEKIAESWKNEGNKFFAKKQFQEAIWSYTAGLNIEGDYDQMVTVRTNILANRSAAYLNIECFNKALEDAEYLLTLNSGNIKGIYRKTKSLCGLQRFIEAIAFLKDNFQMVKGGNQKIFSELLTKTQSMQRQKVTGEYDMVEIYKRPCGYHDDVAEFIGPIKIEPVLGKGRGIVATEKIAAGQLVLVSKAFDIVFSQNEATARSTSGFVTVEDQIKLVHKIGGKLKLDPNLASKIYSLYAGEKFSKFKKGGVDVMPQYGNADAVEALDFKRINAICYFNTFGGSRYTNYSTHTYNSSDFQQGEEYTGLWVLPSYINHSCWDSNCIWKTFGNMMFLRAFKNISAGEEILISYLCPSEPYEKRAECMKYYGFICDCRLCVIDRKDIPSTQTRRDISKFIEDFSRKSEKKMHMMEKYFDEINVCDLKNPELNPFLAYPLMHLADYVWSQKQDLKKAVEFLIKSYQTVTESPLMEIAVQASIKLTEFYCMIGDMKEANKWKEISKNDSLIFSGTLHTAELISQTFEAALFAKNW